jgi:hypothetical protein
MEILHGPTRSLFIVATMQGILDCVVNIEGVYEYFYTSIIVVYLTLAITALRVDTPSY